MPFIQSDKAPEPLPKVLKGKVGLVGLWSTAFLLCALQVVTAQQMEAEPNDTFATATFVGVNDTVKFFMAGDGDTDIIRMTLDSSYFYYISGYKYENLWELFESDDHAGESAEEVYPLPEVEFYSAEDTTAMLQIGIVTNGYRFGMPRIVGYVPPKTGDYYLKLYTFDTEAVYYWIQVVQGASVAEVAAVHEPDNTLSESNAASMLAPFQPIKAALFPLHDLDVYTFEGSKGETFDLSVFPPPGLGPRDLDPVIAVFDQNGFPESRSRLDTGGIFVNDDHHAGITWSRIHGKFPYTGTYYLAVFAYYSRYGRYGGVTADDHLEANLGEYIVALKVGED